MRSLLSTLASLVVVTRAILSHTLTAGSLHTGLNFGCLCGSCQGTIHKGAFLTFSKASVRDLSSLWTPCMQQEKRLVHLLAFCVHMETWPDESGVQTSSLPQCGCRHWGHLYHSISGTALYDFLHWCWMSISPNIPEVPYIFKEKKQSPLEADLNPQRSPSCSQGVYLAALSMSRT